MHSVGGVFKAFYLVIQFQRHGVKVTTLTDCAKNNSALIVRLIAHH